MLGRVFVQASDIASEHLRALHSKRGEQEAPIEYHTDQSSDDSRLTSRVSRAVTHRAPNWAPPGPMKSIRSGIRLQSTPFMYSLCQTNERCSLHPSRPDVNSLTETNAANIRAKRPQRVRSRARWGADRPQVPPPLSITRSTRNPAIPEGSSFGTIGLVRACKASAPVRN